jgi:exopolyphosphatase/guanosine-5'-triphosphate,3'-diphosphate pyrophosphatase
VRLTEAVPALAGRDGAVDASTVARAREIARETLKPLAEPAAVERLALVGGSATTTAFVLKGRRAQVVSYPLTRADLQRTLDRLLQMNLDDRKGIAGLKPQRADILPAGIIVIDTALEILGHDRAIATTADLLLGILLEERDAAGGRTDERRPDTRTHRKFG